VGRTEGSTKSKDQGIRRLESSSDDRSETILLS
jgi:hypothetical protein